MRLDILFAVWLGLGAGGSLAQSATSPAPETADPCLLSDPIAAPEATLATCTALIQSGPPRLALAEAYAIRGVAQRTLGWLDASVGDLTASLELEPFPDTERMLAWTYREMGDLDKAEALYTSVLDKDPHWQGWLARCVVRQDLERHAEALSDCRLALDQDPQNTDALYFTARALNYLEDGRAALPLIRAALELDPTGRRYIPELVWAYYYSGQTRRAIAKARVELQGDPTNAELLGFIDAVAGQ